MATTRLVRSILTGLRRQGFKQQEIAHLTGLSRSSVSGLLAGRRSIDPERAADVVERFSRPAYQRSLEALDYLRDGLTMQEAKRKAQTTSGTLLKNVGPVLRRDPAGQWRARSSDSLPRVMRALAPEGEVRALAIGSRKASVLGKYGHAAKKWRRGERPNLDQFKGQTVATVDGRRVTLITDEATLRRLSDAGEFVDMDDIYG